MGHSFAKYILEKNIPEVGLLSIGEEDTKGNEVTREVFQMLKNSHINFIGNMEGKDVYRGNADVIVCDGFIGNVVLKLTEGLSHYLLNSLKDSSKDKSIDSIENLKNIFNFELSTILLGLNGIVLKCHGSSNYRSFKYAIKEAQSLHESSLINKINYSFNPTTQI